MLVECHLRTAPVPPGTPTPAMASGKSAVVQVGRPPARFIL